jgi:hypothetical protein
MLVSGTYVSRAVLAHLHCTVQGLRTIEIRPLPLVCPFKL